MLVDITLKITPAMIKEAGGNERKSLVGHIGTHFDVMDKEFPLAYTKTKAIVFDVSKIQDRDIDAKDISLEKIEEGMFVLFYTGFIESIGYGNKEYFTNHPQLSNTLIESLIEKRISMIGVDFAGIRRGKGHTSIDQYLANKNIFVIENVCSLKQLCNQRSIVMHTYPMSYQEITGLPCRIIGEI